VGLFPGVPLGHPWLFTRAPLGPKIDRPFGARRYLWGLIPGVPVGHPLAIYAGPLGAKEDFNRASSSPISAALLLAVRQQLADLLCPNRVNNSKCYPISLPWQGCLYVQILRDAQTHILKVDRQLLG